MHVHSTCCAHEELKKHSQHGAIVIPPCHQQRHAERPALQPQKRVAMRIWHHGQNYHTSGEMVQMPPLTDSSTYHATFFIILAELQCQITQRLRA